MFETSNFNTKCTTNFDIKFLKMDDYGKTKVINVFDRGMMNY